jgi:uncharacterized membrane protein YdjX (TVP38/TMEM64 family)
MQTRHWIVLIVVAALAAAAFTLPLQQWLRAAIDWTAAHRELAGLAFVALYVVATVAFVPGLPLTLAAGALFGVIEGSVLVSIGSTLGATAAFFAGRTIARDWVRRRIAAWPRFLAVDRAVESRGFLVVLLTRLSPLFPFFLLNYAYGVTAARPRDYVLGSWLGMMPATVAYVYAGSLAADVSQALAGEAELGVTGWLLLGLGFAATVTVTVLVTRVARGFLDREIGIGGVSP